MKPFACAHLATSILDDIVLHAIASPGFCFRCMAVAFGRHLIIVRVVTIRRLVFYKRRSCFAPTYQARLTAPFNLASNVYDCQKAAFASDTI